MREILISHPRADVPTGALLHWSKCMTEWMSKHQRRLDEGTTTRIIRQRLSARVCELEGCVLDNLEIVETRFAVQSYAIRLAGLGDLAQLEIFRALHQDHMVRAYVGDATDKRWPAPKKTIKLRVGVDAETPSQSPAGGSFEWRGRRRRSRPGG